MRKKFVYAAAAASIAAISLTCSPGYILQAGIEEAKILSRRRPIAQVLSDARTREDTRRKLRLVVDARTFAAEMLGLDAGRSYTTFTRMERDTLALVLSAARRDRFEQYTWWFPIVGDVPYKGFFSEEDAFEAAEELRRAGYDTYIRPTGAFSTLGWFNDPLLSTVLDYGDVPLASTVIHELTHNTLYIPGEAAFNESLASFVGDRGAIAYFCTLEGDEGERCRRARAAWSDNLVFGRFLDGLIADLEALYARTDLPLEELLARREQVFERAREMFRARVEPRLQIYTYRGFIEGPLNNASLMARRTYYDRLHLFEAVFQRYGGDLVAAVDAIREAAERGDSDPYGALRRLAQAGDADASAVRAGGSAERAAPAVSLASDELPTSRAPAEL